MAPKRVGECNVLCTTGVLKAGLDEDNYADSAFGKLDKADLHTGLHAICKTFFSTALHHGY
jgi:hypothetical protein